jgi:hypothetical protein
MFGLKWRSLLFAGFVTLGAAVTCAPSADAGWGYGYGYSAGYRGYAAPVYAYRPAYTYVAPRYVAPVRRLYRPVVPVAPVVRVAPVYGAGYPGYSPYGVYSSGYRGYGTGISIGVGVAPVGYIGY